MPLLPLKKTLIVRNCLKQILTVSWNAVERERNLTATVRENRVKSELKELNFFLFVSECQRNIIDENVSLYSDIRPIMLMI